MALFIFRASFHSGVPRNFCSFFRRLCTVRIGLLRAFCSLTTQERGHASPLFFILYFFFFNFLFLNCSFVINKRDEPTLKRFSACSLKRAVVIETTADSKQVRGKGPLHHYRYVMGMNITSAQTEICRRNSNEAGWVELNRIEKKRRSSCVNNSFRSLVMLFCLQSWRRSYCHTVRTSSCQFAQRTQQFPMSYQRAHQQVSNRKTTIDFSV